MRSIGWCGRTKPGPESRWRAADHALVNLAHQVVDEVRSFFGDQVFRTVATAQRQTQ